MPAVAVTDTNALFGALEFSETAAVAAGIQPIMGCQLGLICLTGGAGRPAGPAGARRASGAAEALLDRLRRLPGRLYVEIAAPRARRPHARGGGGDRAGLRRDGLCPRACRWWRPTTSISPSPTCTRRMTRSLHRRRRLCRPIRNRAAG
jgi:hypothetical protein